MIHYQIAKHAVAFPSKLVAQNGGEHIYNITLTSNTDNGCIIAKGAFESADRYADGGTVANFTAAVVAKAANGNWYVEVTTPGNALLVYQEPLISEEWTQRFKKEENFYNASGEVTRAYALHTGDIFEVSAEAFSNAGTETSGSVVKLEVGCTISSISTDDTTKNKMVLTAKA